MIGTPIGNLQDLTPRAPEVLAAVDLIACEDTRVTRKLLARFEIQNEVTSYHAHSSPAKRETLIARLEQGDIAQVSDAGTPGVSDPGAALVAAE